MIAHGAWVDGRFVAVDLETTDKEPDTARLVSVAVVLCGGEAETVGRDWLVAREVPEEASAINGITTERAMAEGRPLEEVLPEVLDWLEECVARWGAPVVAFNARYDFTVLDREARRLGLVPLQDRVKLRVIDPLTIDKHLHLYRRGSRKLDAQCAHYGARLEEAHEPWADALAAARLAWAIGHRGYVIRNPRNGEEAEDLRALEAEWARVRLDLDELHAAQERWARAQAISIADYFRREGNHERADGVVLEWPIEPPRAGASRELALSL